MTEKDERFERVTQGMNDASIVRDFIRKSPPTWLPRWPRDRRRPSYEDAFAALARLEAKIATYSDANFGILQAERDKAQAELTETRKENERLLQQGELWQQRLAEARRDLEEARRLLARYIFIVTTEADSEAVLDAVHGFSDDILNFLQRTEKE